MTSWVVCDSGIILATLLKERHTDHAEALLTRWKDTDFALAVPYLFGYEMIAAIRKHVVRGTLSAAEGLLARQKALSINVTYYFDNDLLKTAFNLATRLNRPTAYDSQYLALAERLGCEFWTADERLYNATQSSLGYVRWLGAMD
jgi:predicted nucleic acid-binding protein